MPGTRSPGLAWSLCLACALCVWPVALTVRADDDAAPIETLTDAIELSADWSQEWKSGDEYVGVFRGHCRVLQGAESYAADMMVVWSREEIVDEQRQQKLSVYLEDHVVITSDGVTRNEASAAAELKSQAGVMLTVRKQQLDTPAEDDALYHRAQERRRGVKRGLLLPTQFTVENDAGGSWQSMPLPGPQNLRRVRIFQRSALPFDFESRELTNRTPPEQVAIVSGGVTILVDGVSLDEYRGELGMIDLSADRAIVWTDPIIGDQPTVIQQRADAKCQVYLEGNIVIRQGDNVVRAERAFYDARENRALILNAELHAYYSTLGSAIRLRAERIRQLSGQSFHAQNAWVTTSQYGKPGYRVEASDVFVEPRAVNLFGGETAMQVDPETGTAMPATQPWTTALNATVFLDDVPVGYLPYVSGTPEEISTPLQAISFQQDRIFGSQLLTKWDAMKLLGLERQNGVRWYADFNLFSERGPGVATDGLYEGIDWWGHPYKGIGLASFVHDDGQDNLGEDRPALEPKSQERGRINLRHKTLITPDTVFQGEIGYVGDRNFLEQWYESEFDRGKDQETLGYLKHTIDNWAGSLLIRPTTNPFEYNTQWLPRGDAYVLGEPILDSPLTWSMHSSVGYANQNHVQLPTDPNDLFTPLPYYAAGDGLVAMSRHEITAPFNVGALKIVPYALGEGAYWGDSFTENSVGRLYGRTGVRASLMASRVMPYVQSDLFNLNGLAHKMVFTADYSIAGANEPLGNISQWNEFDDDAQERFRERLAFNTFGSMTGVIPPMFDPRFYAVRSGAGGTVTAPYHELVDEMHVLSLGWNQRLQTKVGPPDQLRLKDWMTLDTGINLYPAANRDNFGENWGLASARYAWHVGDRTSILANALYDFFDDGQHLWNVGILSQRSYRGSVYLGLRQIQGGPVDSRIATASYSYFMTPDKWVSTATTAYDLGESRNLGQAFTITRIGNDFVFHLGMNFDASKNNVGFTFSIEPKFGPFYSGVPQFGMLPGNIQGVNQ